MLTGWVPSDTQQKRKENQGFFSSQNHTGNVMTGGKTEGMGGNTQLPPISSRYTNSVPLFFIEQLWNCSLKGTASRNPMLRMIFSEFAFLPSFCCGCFGSHAVSGLSFGLWLPPPPCRHEPSKDQSQAPLMSLPQKEQGNEWLGRFGSLQKGQQAIKCEMGGVVSSKPKNYETSLHAAVVSCSFLCVFSNQLGFHRPKFLHKLFRRTVEQTSFERLRFHACVFIAIFFSCDTSFSPLNSRQCHKARKKKNKSKCENFVRKPSFKKSELLSISSLDDLTRATGTDCDLV